MSKTDTPDIDTMNRCFISTDGRTISAMMPLNRLEPDDALVVAAWIVVLAEHHASFTFEQAYAAVCST